MLILGWIVNVLALICFIIVLIKQFQNAGCGSRHYRNHHLRHLDLYLGLDERHEGQYQNHHVDRTVVWSSVSFWVHGRLQFLDWQHECDSVI